MSEPSRHRQPPATASPHPEAALLASVGAGDQAAFRLLVERHVAGVTTVARGMLGDASEADDLAQEVFLRLWRSAATLELGPAGLKPWLRRVVSNLAIDRLRVSRRAVVTDEPPEQVDRPRQADPMATRDLQVRVQRAIAKLPERQRLALVLFHFDGLTQSEVAAAMDASDEAVESLLARGRRALKADLRADWEWLAPEPEG